MAFDALWIGTAAFAGAGVLACFVLPLILARPSNLQNITKAEMIKLTVTLVTTTAICLWLFWAVVYVSQMYPIIAPERSVQTH